MSAEAIGMPAMQAPLVGDVLAVVAPAVELGAEEQMGRDPEFYLNTYGVGPDELDQQVAFAGHEGTFRAMLDDAACPVGGQLAAQFAERGLEGVTGFFTGLTMMGAKAALSTRTRDYHGGKVSRDELLGKPAVPDSAADFLA